MIRTITNDLAWLMTLMTQKDCTTLKKLIVENPDAPLLIFAGEYAHGGVYRYESVPSCDAFFEEITMYGDQWLNKDEFEEVLGDDMANDEQYENLSDEQLDDEIAKIVAKTAFVRAIVIYVG